MDVISRTFLSLQRAVSRRQAIHAVASPLCSCASWMKPNMKKDEGHEIITHLGAVDDAACSTTLIVNSECKRYHNL